MKAKREKQQPTVLIIVLIAILVLSSLLSLFANFNNEKIQNINVNVQFVVEDEPYPAQQQSLPINSTIYGLLTSIGASFEQDGDVKNIGQLQNSYLEQNYWQVLINNQPVNDWNTELKQDDYVLLYYGKMLEFFNISLNIQLFDLVQEDIISVQKGLTVNNLISNYGNLTCLFNYCNNQDYNWNILLNNNSISNYSTILKENDELLLRYD